MESENYSGATRRHSLTAWFAVFLVAGWLAGYVIGSTLEAYRSGDRQDRQLIWTAMDQRLSLVETQIREVAEQRLKLIEAKLSELESARK